MSFMIHNFVFYFLSNIILSQAYVCVFIWAHTLQIYITCISYMGEKANFISHQSNINEHY